MPVSLRRISVDIKSAAEFLPDRTDVKPAAVTAVADRFDRNDAAASYRGGKADGRLGTDEGDAMAAWLKNQSGARLYGDEIAGAKFLADLTMQPDGESGWYYPNDVKVADIVEPNLRAVAERIAKTHAENKVVSGDETPASAAESLRYKALWENENVMLPEEKQAVMAIAEKYFPSKLCVKAPVGAKVSVVEKEGRAGYGHRSLSGPTQRFTVGAEGYVMLNLHKLAGDEARVVVTHDADGDGAASSAEVIGRMQMECFKDARKRKYYWFDLNPKQGAQQQ